MKDRSPVGIAVVALTALVLTACGGAVSDEYEREEPYTLEAIDGDDGIARVLLTDSAVERLGIETVPVESSGSKLVVPYDAVFIDAHGEFWVYTNPEPLAFVRAPIVIDRETSSQAILSDGPPVGTLVVTVGVPELYGSETEFGT
ncbi:MAG: hypothetical protein ACXWFU_13745 [Actinomycetota bacterium]